MTVRELKKALKEYDNSAEVYLVKDWAVVDEYGLLTELAPLRDVTSQRVVIDVGLDFEDRTEVLLGFDE